MAAGDVITVRGSTYGRQCAAFDGTDDYILADAHAVARVAANDTVGTYSAWIYVDKLYLAEECILSVGDNDSATEYFQFWAYGQKLRAKLYHGGVIQWDVYTPSILTAKKWTHVAVVQNGIQPVLYIDGSAVAGTNSTATDLTYWYDELTGCDKFAIGVLESNATHTLDFNGMISDVKYWNHALTAQEVWNDCHGVAQATLDANYLQLHLLKGEYGIEDQGLGNDDGTLTGHAYLCDWGSEWSREVKLNAVVADDLQTIQHPGYAETLILKAA